MFLHNWKILSRVEVLFYLAAGLVLFLYAVHSLSIHLKESFGEGTKLWIARFTGNSLSGLLTGIFATTILDSSSAVIIITIVMVNAQVVSLRQAMAIVLGANIGTTVGSQLIATDIMRYSPILLIVGYSIILISGDRKSATTGKIILFFGLLFFGLKTMETSVEPLRGSTMFLDWMERARNPFFGSLVGAFVTFVIQSSSATVGMAIILSKKGILSVAGGIAVMLGAELGTCSDTLIATIKGSKQAVKTGLFHLFFNLTTILIGLIFFQPFLDLVFWISDGAPEGRIIANAHMIFNISGALLFIGLIPYTEKLLHVLLPEK